MRLVASMIVRDEASRYLRPALASLERFCDWIVVLDDGSVDDSADVARMYRTVVHSDPGSTWDAEGEGRARGRLLDLTLRLEPAPDWVLSIDADEFVPDGPRLRRFLDALRPAEVPTAVSLTMREVWTRGEGAWAVRVDGGWAPREVPVVWTPPRAPLSAGERWEYGWTIPDVALACGREPEVVRFLDPVPSSVDLLHLGWSDPAERRARAERYARLDDGRYHARAHLRSILEEPTLVPHPAPDDAALLYSIPSEPPKEEPCQ